MAIARDNFFIYLFIFFVNAGYDLQPVANSTHDTVSTIQRETLCNQDNENIKLSVLLYKR